MEKTIRLVTVTGSRTDTLEYMINHYYDIVDEIHIVVHDAKNGQYDRVVAIINKYRENGWVNSKSAYKDKIFLYKHANTQEYNWETVTALYNEVKSKHPDDWWIVSDDDEFHLYSKPIRNIIRDCDENGWNIVRGGFIDRIGENGKFSEIEPYKKNKNIFSQFPYAGFFRFPLSGACPNKICIIKGNIEITGGQHYAKFDEHTTWRWQGWNHPLIAPVNEYNVQVHHFKWDSTVGARLKKIADIDEYYACSKEYLKMYQALRVNNFELDLKDPKFDFEYCPVANFESYKSWKKILNKIISI